MQNERGANGCETECSDHPVEPRADRDPLGLASQQHRKRQVAQGEEWRPKPSATDGVGGVAPPNDSIVSAVSPKPQAMQEAPRNSGNSRVDDVIVSPRAVPVAEHAQDAEGDFEDVDSPAVDERVVRADVAGGDSDEVGGSKERSDVVRPSNTIADWVSSGWPLLVSIAVVANLDTGRTLSGRLTRSDESSASYRTPTGCLEGSAHET